jgi:hypothetical protein
VTPGHPEYPANHGCVTEAIMDALAAFFLGRKVAEHILKHHFRQEDRD